MKKKKTRACQTGYNKLNQSLRVTLSRDYLYVYGVRDQCMKKKKKINKNVRVREQ